MIIHINNFNELLDFIKRDDISSKEATEIVCKALNLVSLYEMTKDEIIKYVQYYIKTFSLNDNSVSPFYLGQKGIEFNIKDIYKE